MNILSLRLLVAFLQYCAFLSIFFSSTQTRQKCRLDQLSFKFRVANPLPEGVPSSNFISFVGKIIW